MSEFDPFGFLFFFFAPDAELNNAVAYLRGNPDAYESEADHRVPPGADNRLPLGAEHRLRPGVAAQGDELRNSVPSRRAAKRFRRRKMGS